MKKERLYLFDNVKAILILLVVLGHSLESLLKYEDARNIYIIIYSFHIPLFAFCSGYFTRFSPTNIRKKLIYPFLLFQVLYLLFDKLLLLNNTNPTFTKPYWLMWYLFALIVWELLLPLFETASFSKKCLLLTCAFGAGILSGFDETIGYYLSLSRIIVYFPFFLGAYYLKQLDLLPRFLQFARSLTGRLLSSLCVILTIIYLIFYRETLKLSWLYGSTSYELSHYNPSDRMIFYLIALIWIGFLLGVLPKKKRFFSAIGENSLAIYLLHGFIIRYLNTELLIFDDMEYKIIAAFTLSLFLVFILSRKFVQRLCSPLFKMP